MDNDFLTYTSDLCLESSLLEQMLHFASVINVKNECFTLPMNIILSLQFFCFYVSIKGI